MKLWKSRFLVVYQTMKLLKLLCCFQIHQAKGIFLFPNHQSLSQDDHAVTKVLLYAADWYVAFDYSCSLCLYCSNVWKTCLLFIKSFVQTNLFLPDILIGVSPSGKQSIESSSRPVPEGNKMSLKNFAHWQKVIRW